MTTSTEHVAHRPSWDCKRCGDPWPCATARADLVAELNTIQLALYTWTHREEAAADLRGMPMAEAFDRFLAWTRPPR